VIKLSCFIGALFLAAFISVQAAHEKPDPCMDEETRERIRAIVLEGIDEALRDQIVHVFEMWLKDDTEQPKRAVNGMHNGIRAYMHSRANALKWNPPNCPEKAK
jgi:hypothetical protein